MGLVYRRIAGPERMSMATLELIEREIDAVPDHLWVRARTEIHMDWQTLHVFVTIPDEDPFEPTRRDSIFDSIERIIVAHIPADIPIYENSESWSVSISSDGDNATLDFIMGGERVPHRTEHASDGVGPPNRNPPRS